MKFTNHLLLIFSVLAISLWSCKPKETVTETAENAVEEVTNTIKDGEDCNYVLIEGIGKITQMNTSNVDNVVIKFDFKPVSKVPSIRKSVPNNGRKFNVKGVGKYPPKDWCEKNGIEQGASFKVHRYELAANSDSETCETVKFSFPEFEKNGWK